MVLDKLYKKYIYDNLTCEERKKHDEKLNLCMMDYDILLLIRQGLDLKTYVENEATCDEFSECLEFMSRKQIIQLKNLNDIIETVNCDKEVMLVLLERKLGYLISDNIVMDNFRLFENSSYGYNKKSSFELNRYMMKELTQKEIEDILDERNDHNDNFYKAWLSIPLPIRKRMEKVRKNIFCTFLLCLKYIPIKYIPPKPLLKIIFNIYTNTISNISDFNESL